MSKGLKGRLRQLQRKNPQVYDRLRKMKRGSLSRSEFLKIAAGMAGAGALGTLAGWTANKAYVGSTRPTIESLDVTEAYDYIIGVDGSTYYAKSGKTGKIEYSGSDATMVIHNAIDALTSERTWKEKIVLKGKKHKPEFWLRMALETKEVPPTEKKRNT